MDPNKERDEWLMAQVALGRRDHLEPLIRRYSGPLLTFINRMVGDTHRSEELFQEVFLAVWKKRKTYRFPRLFKPWLYKIALNKCRQAFRASSLRVTFGHDDAVAAATADGDAPDDPALAAETAAIVSQAVTQLPVKQRTVVVLRIWNEMGYDEIADLMKTSVSTVRSNMHHGLAALRSSLQPHLSPSEMRDEG